MKMFAALVCATVMGVASVSLSAHQETLKGKVLSVTGTSVEVNVVDPKTSKETKTTFKTNAETKILRGEVVVTFANAKIKKDENIAVTVNHDTDVTLALVIRLDAAK